VLGNGTQIHRLWRRNTAAVGRLRFRKVAFQAVEADALRLVVNESWGGGDAHVFAFDAL